MVTVAGCGGGGGANNTTAGDGGVGTGTEDGVATGTEETTMDGNETTTGNETATDGNATDNETGTANLRVAHVAAGAPAVDVYVNGEEFLTDVDYGSISEYAQVPAGEYNVTITAAGEDEVVLQENVTVEAANYTVAAIPLAESEENATTTDTSTDETTDANATDSMNETTEADASQSLIELLVLEDGVPTAGDGNATETTTDASMNETTTDANATDSMNETTENETNASENASVRIVHASPDAGPVNVVVSGTDTVLAENVTFGTATEYVEVPAGDYTVDIVPANDTETIATSVALSVEADVPYTAYAAGYATGDQADETPLEVFLAVDDPEVLGETGDTGDAGEDTTTTESDATETTEETTTSEADAEGEGAGGETDASDPDAPDTPETPDTPDDPAGDNATTTEGSA
ncbi:DUF4397 domain-containing protein [Halomarina salina]|uniref:DUF4397 domain-containing protein n=1 Tax=Halomarina salina TaxID=1872699 RepID=A0ABD5RK35_9EURY|nr:DUF4397 domain-containing protein [Halomarina salina]